jgi:predicted nucleic acid-binding protein
LIFVLDASITAVWGLADENSDLADHLLTVVQIDGAMVPPIWWYEIRNILLMAERRKRILATDADEFLRSLAQMSIRIADPGDGQSIVRLARVHQLSAYDAAYLDLAIRQGLPLGTLDSGLAKAAATENISVLSI